jgi:hypothetical protein
MTNSVDGNSGNQLERIIRRDLHAIRAQRLAGFVKQLEQDPNAWIETGQLVAIFVASAKEPIHPLLLEHVRRRLDGAVPKPRGRRGPDAARRLSNELIACMFERYEAWLTKRKKTQGLNGWSCIRTANWWQGPPSERAARMVQKRLAANTTWERVRNIAYEQRKRWSAQSDGGPSRQIP